MRQHTFVLSRLKGFQHLLAAKGNVRTPRQVVSEAISNQRTLPSYQRLFMPTLAFRLFAPILLALIWLDWIVSRALRFAQSLLRNMAVRRGLNAIGRIALGDDSPIERIVSVGRSDEFYKSITLVDLPDAVEERFASRAKLYCSRIGTAVYRPEANYVQTTQLTWENIVGAVETALANIELAHCQYYQDDWCIEKIAELIAGSSRLRALRGSGKRVAGHDAFRRQARQGGKTRKAEASERPDAPGPSKGVNQPAKDASKLRACGAGSKQAILIDYLVPGRDPSLAELVAALKPWSESSVKSALYWDVAKVKGYGVRTETADDCTQRYHLVLPKGVEAPLGHLRVGARQEGHE